MSDRTLFAKLSLMGQGTGQVQCLRSYLQHVAFRHSLKPTRLLSVLAQRYSDVPVSAAASSLQGGANLHTGVYVPQRLRRALELATGENLRASTLEQLYGAFSLSRSRGLGEMRYCAFCVQEDAQPPYARLLWELSFVQACPLHGVKLRRRGCGAPESEHLPIQERPVLDGVCHLCGSVGFKCVSERPEVADPHSIALAREAARVLELQGRAEFTFDESLLREGISKLVNARYGGSVVSAAQDAGLSRGTVCIWLRGSRAALPYVLQLCVRTGADVEHLLQGEYVRAAENYAECSDLRVPAQYRYNNLSSQTLKQLLTEASRRPIPPSVHAFAREIGIHIDTPRHRAPQEARLLSSAYARSCAERSQKVEAQYERAYEAAAMGLLAEGRGVHRKSLQERSGVHGFRADSPKRRALERVVAAHGSQTARPASSSAAAQTSRIALTLKKLKAEALASDSSTESEAISPLSEG